MNITHTEAGPITPEALTKEGDRNYDLGRKHMRGELLPATETLQELYRTSQMLRLRLEQYTPEVKGFEEWDRHTEAMRAAENVLGMGGLSPDLPKIGDIVMSKNRSHPLADPLGYRVESIGLPYGNFAARGVEYGGLYVFGPNEWCLYKLPKADAPKAPEGRRTQSTMKSWVTNPDGSESIEGPAPLKGSYHFWKNVGMLFWEVKGGHRPYCGMCFKKAHARRAIKNAFREARGDQSSRK